MNELDIWRSANILLKRYKADAVLIAAKCADAFLEQGDIEGCGVWIRITRAITELERKMSAEGGESIKGARRAATTKVSKSPPTQALRDLPGLRRKGSTRI